MIVVNPIQRGALKNINVRKVKNDKVDAYKIAMLYRLKVLRTSQVPVDSLRGLRLLCRQRSELTGDVTRYKNRLTAYLDQVFPGYDKVFSDVGGASSRAVLKEGINSLLNCVSRSNTLSAWGYPLLPDLSEYVSGPV